MGIKVVLGFVMALLVVLQLRLFPLGGEIDLGSYCRELLLKLRDLSIPEHAVR